MVNVRLDIVVVTTDLYKILSIILEFFVNIIPEIMEVELMILFESFFIKLLGLLVDESPSVSPIVRGL